jgi:hypothetical protein
MREDELEPLDDDDRALVAKLRQLPPEGVEPDWQALEAAIRAEVGDDSPRPWWRNWRWIIPVWTLATTAVITLLVIRSDKPVEHHSVAPLRVDAGVIEEQPQPAAATTAMWLDGEVFEVDDAALEALDAEARAALEPEEDVSGGILPMADYGWIDTLDDEAVMRAEDWLKRNRS